VRFVIPVAFVAATACGDREVAELERVRDKVCNCKTASCAEDAMKAIPPPRESSDGRRNRRAQLVAREMLDCFSRLLEAERPADPEPQ
jgi:hypothetical protein